MKGTNRRLERLEKQRLQLIHSLDQLGTIQELMGQIEGNGWAITRASSLRHYLECLLGRTELQRSEEEACWGVREERHDELLPLVV
jgi:hypothetical protein